MTIIHLKKNIKRYTRKENGKRKTFIVKDKKSLSISKCTIKILFQLQVQFVSILQCLNLYNTLSHQARNKNLQSLEY